MFKNISLVLISIVAIGGLQQVSAHHSYTMFDREQRLQLTGTVKNFDWRNPHVFITIQVMNADTGEIKDWKIETGSRNMLKRMGWSHTSLKEGDKVELIVNPRVDGEPGGGLVSASVNGKKIGN